MIQDNCLPGHTQNSLSMHKSIIEPIQTRNSGPQYDDSNIMFLSSVEYDAPHDHMFEQSVLEQNSKDFGLIPNPL